MVRRGDLELVTMKEGVYAPRSLGTGMVSSYLVPGPGVTWGKGSIGLAWESLMKEVAGCGLWTGCLCIEGRLTQGEFAVSRN